MPGAIILIFGVFALLACVWLIRLELKWRALFRGKHAQTLEGTLLSACKHIEALAAAHGELHKKVTAMDARVKKSIQGVGTVRFNPFKGTSGSNQSFATALLDEGENGVVFSGLYSRDRVSVFAKPLHGGESEYELTEEERKAMEEAKKN